MTVPPWCKMGTLPTVGTNLTLVFVAAALVLVGLIAIGASRRRPSHRLAATILVVLASALVVLPAAPSSAAGDACPAEYIPNGKLAVDATVTVPDDLWQKTIDAAAANPDETAFDVPYNDATFTLSVDVLSGTVSDPLVITIDRDDDRSANPWGDASTVSGDGWAVTTKNATETSPGFTYVLTYTPTGTTTTIPDAVVTFAFDPSTDTYYEGRTPMLTPVLADGTLGRVQGYTLPAHLSLAHYCYLNLDNTYWKASDEDGSIQTWEAPEPVGGTAPYTWSAQGLNGYTLARDGTLTYVDADKTPGTKVEFQLTVTDSTGLRVTIPAAVIMDKPGTAPKPPTPGVPQNPVLC